MQEVETPYIYAVKIYRVTGFWFWRRRECVQTVNDTGDRQHALELGRDIARSMSFDFGGRFAYEIKRVSLEPIAND